MQENKIKEAAAKMKAIETQIQQVEEKKRESIDEASVLNDELDVLGRQLIE